MSRLANQQVGEKFADDVTLLQTDLYKILNFTWALLTSHLVLMTKDLFGLAMIRFNY